METEISRRVAITGLGTVSVFGEGHAALWSGAIGGDRRFARSSRYDSPFLGLECPDLDIRRILKRGSLSRAPRISQYALIALKNALDEADLDIGAIHAAPAPSLSFPMVDRVVEADAERFVAIKNVTVNEAFFQGHFPGHPTMPGAMITECMVQAAAFLDAPNAEFADNDASPSSDSRRFYCTGVNVRFKSAVIPGDRLTVTLSLVKQLNAMIKTRGRVTTETGVVAEGDLSLAVQEKGEV